MNHIKPTVSVIVSTYNRPDALRLVLLALNHQDTPDFEVVIADDGSTNENRRQIELLQEKLSYKFTYVWQPDDGFRLSMIRNRAASIATGDYLIFLDGDSVPWNSFVSYHRKLAENNYFVPGSRVLLSEDFTAQVLKNDVEIYKWGRITWFYAYLRKWCNRFMPFILLPQLPSVLRKMRTKECFGIRGGNFAVWKKDLLIVNGFDESYCGWGYEDSDFAMRLIHSGIFRKDGQFAVPVFHLWHPNSNLDNKQTNYERLKKTINSSQVRALKGIDQYL